MACKITYKGVRYNSLEELLENNNSNEIGNITPQQKQQALQLYSQYIEQTGKQDIEGFKKWNENKGVKAGVEELFESNPELADAIYEALIPEGYTRLYRAENEEGVDSPAPSWLLEQPEVIAQKEAEGRWFYKSYEEAKTHADIFGSSGISYIDVPINEVETFNAKYNKFAGGYGKEGREYFVSKELATNRKSFEQQKQQAQQQYSAYIDSIFPDSKVKDIVYHGTNAKFEKFSDDFLGKKDPGYLGRGFYFWIGSNALEGAKHTAFAYLNRDIEPTDVIKAVINVTNLKEVARRDYSNTGKDLGDYDAVKEKPLRKNSTTQIAVKSASQIHILGSKQDIEGFKKFVGSENIQYKKNTSTGIEIVEPKKSLALGQGSTTELDLAIRSYMLENPDATVEEITEYLTYNGFINLECN